MASSVESLAREVGLFVSTWSPGDGATRYRFFGKEMDYFAGDGLKTVLGRKDALLWLSGYRAGRGAVGRYAYRDAEAQLDRNLAGWYSNPYEKS